MGSKSARTYELTAALPSPLTLTLTLTRTSYDDFVYFLLAEEDKECHAALQYWFHVLDVDGDGPHEP